MKRPNKDFHLFHELLFLMNNLIDLRSYFVLKCFKNIFNCPEHNFKCAEETHPGEETNGATKNAQLVFKKKKITPILFVVEKSIKGIFFTVRITLHQRRGLVNIFLGYLLWMSFLSWLFWVFPYQWLQLLLLQNWRERNGRGCESAERRNFRWQNQDLSHSLECNRITIM